MTEEREFSPDWPHGWVTRDGREVTEVKRHNRGLAYPVTGDIGGYRCTFTAKGRSIGDDTETHHDLVNKSAPAPVQDKTKDTPPKWCVEEAIRLARDEESGTSMREVYRRALARLIWQTQPEPETEKAHYPDWFAGEVDCDGNELVTLRADELQKLKDEREKFMWQVRDTCARAEKAEASLAAYEPPVDPDLLIARESAAKDNPEWAAGILAGEWDIYDTVQHRLRAIKLARERGALT